MTSDKSRYFSISKATLQQKEIRYRGAVATEAESAPQIAYQRRRFIPQDAADPSFTDITVSTNDRLDLIAYRIYGDPEQWWRLADANNAMDPYDLVSTPGRTLRVPLPQFQSDVPEEGDPEA